MTTLKDLISQYRKKGYVIDDEATLEKNYQLLAEEFQIPHDEAMANIKRSLDRRFGLIKTEFDNPNPTDEVVRLGDMLGGYQVMCEGVVTALVKPASPKLKYGGILSDDTGSVKFIVLEGNETDLELGKSYRFDGCRSSEDEPLTLLVFKKSPISKIKSKFKPPSAISTLVSLTPGICTIKVKCTSLRIPHEKAHQQGRVGDETAGMTFATWKSGGASAPTLEEGRVYVIRNAVAQPYKQAVTLDLSMATAQEVDEDLDVKPDGVEVIGDVVRMWGAEVRSRCPDCRKPLQPAGADLLCDDHGIITNPLYELRVKARVDDGEHVATVIFGNRMIEALTEFTLEEALRIMSSSPFGKEAIIDILHDRLFGRRVVLRCSTFEDWHIAQEGRFLYPDIVPAWKCKQNTLEGVA
jgi:hypothetical protein